MGELGYIQGDWLKIIIVILIRDDYDLDQVGIGGSVDK